MASQEVQELAAQVNQLYSVKKVAAILGTTTKFVRTLITQRRLRCVKLSRRCVRVPRDAVEALIREAEQG